MVSVKEQKLGIYQEGRLKKEYLVSTSKFGLGDQPNSYRTPLGKHEVVAKIGHGLPKGAVLKSRSWNGEVLKPNAPGRDPIVSRILWLRGMESADKNAQNRFIYIHGTPEECNLGKPASYGCIRMGMADVVDVFNEVSIGAKVVVTKGALPHGGKPEKPEPDPAAEQPAEDLLIAATQKVPADAPQDKDQETAGDTSPAASEPVPVTTAQVQEEKAPSKGLFGLFGRNRAKPEPAPAATAQGQPNPKSQIKIGPELPDPEDATAQKERDNKTSKSSFFSLKNKWPLRRAERAETASGFRTPHYAKTLRVAAGVSLPSGRTLPHPAPTSERSRVPLPEDSRRRDLRDLNDSELPAEHTAGARCFVNHDFTQPWQLRRELAP